MDMTPDRCYRVSAFGWTSNICIPPRFTMGPSILKLKCALHRMNMGDNMNIIDDAKSVIFTIWFDKLRGIHREIHRAYNDELFTAKHEIHVWMTWQFHEGWWPYILKWCFNRRQVHDWLTNVMGVGMMHAINQRIILRRSQERKSFMMNQAVPHLGAGSSLMNDASSNCWRQPGMGTAFTAE